MIRALLGILGLAAIALLAARELEPPPPSVLIDVPDPSRPPIDDLNLNEGNG